MAELKRNVDSRHTSQPMKESKLHSYNALQVHDDTLFKKSVLFQSLINPDWLVVINIVTCMKGFYYWILNCTLIHIIFNKRFTLRRSISLIQSARALASIKSNIFLKKRSKNTWLVFTNCIKNCRKYIFNVCNPWCKLVTSKLCSLECCKRAGPEEIQ